MTFTCSLEIPVSTGSDKAAPGRMLEWPEVPESGDAAVMRACELLAQTDARFHIGGFGSDNWILDIGYDLSVFLEQLPDALRELSAGNECEINLYSQGVERVLRFRPRGDSVRIECISGTSWEPDPAVEEASRPKLIAMLSRVAAGFARAVVTLDEDAAHLEPISSWLTLT